MGAAEPVPVAVDEDSETTEKLPAEESKPTAAKKRQETIEIPGYGKVLTGDVAKHYDPECPRKCDTGSRKAGRPFLGRVVWVRELCDCAVEGYKKAHPIEDDEEPIVAGTIAQAAAVGSPRALALLTNPRGLQVTRLRTRVAELQAQLEAVQAEVAADLGPIADELAGAESAAADAAMAVATLTTTLGEVRDQISALQAREVRLGGELDDAQVRAAAAESALATHAARAEEVRRARAGDERHFQRQIERVERRIERIIAYHPEAASG